MKNRVNAAISVYGVFMHEPDDHHNEKDERDYTTEFEQSLDDALRESIEEQMNQKEQQ